MENDAAKVSPIESEESPDPVPSDATNEAFSERRSLKSLPWFPSTQLTLMFHASSVAMVTLGVLILLAWNLVIADPKSFAELKIDFATSIVQLSSALMIGLGICSLLISVRFSHRVSGPMVALRRQVDSLIAGDYSKRVNLRKNDEFKDFADLLNDLADRLEKKS